MKKRTKKYYAPQNENTQHICDYPGCTQKGEYRAPKDKTLKEYYWFCLQHVQEYNAKWNYYGDDSFKEEPHKHKRFYHTFKSKIHYQFGYDLWDESEFFTYEYSNEFDGSAQYSSDGIYFTVEERRFLKTLELNIRDANPENLKKQYKKMAKKYHPDMNREDKDAEEKFKLLSEAYQHLKDKFERIPNYYFK